MRHKLLTLAEIGNDALFTYAGFNFALELGKNTINVFDPRSQSSSSLRIQNVKCIKFLCDKIL